MGPGNSGNFDLSPGIYIALQRTFLLSKSCQKPWIASKCEITPGGQIVKPKTLQFHSTVGMMISKHGT